MTSALCAFATASEVAPLTSWISMYVGMVTSGGCDDRRVRRSMERIRSCAMSTRGYVMGDHDFRGLAQRLIDNAIPLRQANECTQLVLGGVCVEVQMQPDTLKSDRRVLGHAQRATKIDTDIARVMADTGD